MDLPRGVGGVGWTAIPIRALMGWRRFHDPISPKPFAVLMLIAVTLPGLPRFFLDRPCPSLTWVP